MARIAVQEPQLAAALVHKQPHGPSSQQGSTALAAEKDEGDSMPWRAFIRNRPLQALAYTHFCNNWCVIIGSLPRRMRRTDTLDMPDHGWELAAPELPNSWDAYPAWQLLKAVS